MAAAAAPIGEPLPRVYSIEEILSQRSRYKEKPYPDFSIMEVCRRKYQTTRLKRGDSAWVPGRKAVTTEEAVEKHVRASLNKLALDNYDVITEELKQSWLLEETAIKVFVRLVFDKALKEPTFSHMYARLCYDMAKFEVDSQPPPGDGGTSAGKADTPSATTPAARRVSKFRLLVIQQAQAEFTKTEKETAELPALASAEGGSDGATEAGDEDDSSPMSKLAKRKRANIKFVGELFLLRVVSLTVMSHTMTQLLKLRAADPSAATSATTTSSDLPTDLDIEVVTELIETVGKMMVTYEDGRVFIAKAFDRIRNLIESNSYSHRIRFKLMGTEELRDNNWVPRAVSRASTTATPSTTRSDFLDMPRSGTRRTGPLLPSKSPASFATPTTRKAPQPQRFPESPAVTSSPTASTAPGSWISKVSGREPAAVTGSSMVASASSGGGSGTAGGSDAPPAFPSVVAARTAAAPDVPLEKFMRAFVATLFEAAGPDASPVPNWTGKFYKYSLSDDDLYASVVAEVTSVASLTTAKDAQQNAAVIIARSLQLPTTAIVTGLSRFLNRCIEDALYEDAPKVFERLTVVIKLVSGFLVSRGSGTSPPPEAPAVVSTMKPYELMCMTIMSSVTRLQGHDDIEDPVPELMRLWHCLPPAEPIGEEGVAFIIKSRGSGSLSAALAAEMLKFVTVTNAAMAPVEAVRRWSQTVQGKAAVEFVSILRDVGVLSAAANPAGA